MFFRERKRQSTTDFCAGVISGALLYIRDDFSTVEKKTWLQVSKKFYGPDRSTFDESFG